MANKRLYQFLYSKQPKLTMINGIVTFGAGGTIASGSTFTAGVYSVTGNGNGTFQVKLSDNYAAFVGGQFTVHSGLSASVINISSLVGSSSYQIVSVGNSTWSTVGFDSDYTPVAGAPFMANAVVGSGTGTARLLTPTNISTIQMLQTTTGLLTNNAPNFQNTNGAPGRGSSFFFQTMAPTATMVSSAAVISQVVVNPTGSTQASFKLWFRDSSSLAGN